MTLSTVTKISFLFIALTASCFSGSFAIETVLDINGSPVKANVPYNIQSVTQPTKFVSRGKRVLNTLCPQAALLSSHPSAVKFLVDTETGSVPLSTNLNVKFDAVDECFESGIWKLDSNPLLPVPDVTATGTLKALDSTIQIEKYNDGYKFNMTGYGDIGLYLDPVDQTGHLGLVPDSALKVGFVPVTVA